MQTYRTKKETDLAAHKLIRMVTRAYYTDSFDVKTKAGIRRVYRREAEIVVVSLVCFYCLVLFLPVIIAVDL